MFPQAHSLLQPLLLLLLLRQKQCSSMTRG
jgi:hypothetical protein